MHKNEIVVSKDHSTIGLCIGAENGIPIIHGRYSPYSPNSKYGGVDRIQWIDTNTYCTLDEWNHKTNQHMSTKEVLDIFNISLESSTATNPKYETTNGWGLRSNLVNTIEENSCYKLDLYDSELLADILLSKFNITIK